MGRAGLLVMVVVMVVMVVGVSMGRAAATSALPRPHTGRRGGRRSGGAVNGGQAAVARADGAGGVQGRGRLVAGLWSRLPGPHGPGPHHAASRYSPRSSGRGSTGRGRSELCSSWSSPGAVAPAAAAASGPGRLPAEAEVSAELVVHVLDVVGGGSAVVAQEVLAARDEGGVGQTRVAAPAALLALLLPTPTLSAASPARTQQLAAHPGQPALRRFHLHVLLARVDSGRRARSRRVVVVVAGRRSLLLRRRGELLRSSPYRVGSQWSGHRAVTHYDDDDDAGDES